MGNSIIQNWLCIPISASPQMARFLAKWSKGPSKCHMLLVHVFPSLIRPTLCTLGMSQAISFTKSRLSLLSQSHKQVTKPGEGKDTSLLPIKQGSVFYHFSMRVAKPLQGILPSITVTLSSTIEINSNNTLEAVRNLITEGENEEGRAAILVRMHSSSRLPFFAGKRDSGPSQEMLQLSVCTSPSWTALHSQRRHQPLQHPSGSPKPFQGQGTATREWRIVDVAPAARSCAWSPNDHVLWVLGSGLNPGPGYGS